MTPGTARSALPAERAAAEHLGHEHGAFTGAAQDRVGKFERAHDGTVFLDRITEMPFALQSRMLRRLQEGTLKRLGSHRRLQLDGRVIAACNRHPRNAMRKGRLRDDPCHCLKAFGLAWLWPCCRSLPLDATV